MSGRAGRDDGGRRLALLRGVAAAVVLLTALTGCASLPISGPVATATPQIPARYALDVLAEGPQQDATVEQIVEGFLQAAAYGFTDDFAVARSYLAPEIADGWNPMEQVHIYAGEENPTLATQDDGGITVTIEETAVVDAAGRYTQLAPGPLSTDFTLVRGEGGQWRIAALEDGLLISDLNFEQTFASSPLQFLTIDYSATVPDLRWYPFEGRAVSMVRGLLGGPSGWLSGAVVSAFPEGTRLGSRGVTVEDGAATVDLTAQALAASEAERGLIATQLTRTLTALSSVTSVRITVEGDSFESGEAAPNLALPQSVSSAVMLSEGALVRWNGRELIPVEGVGPLTGLDPSHPAVPFLDTDVPMVVLSGTGTLVTVPTDSRPATVLWEGADLVPPSIDRNGWVWTSPRVGTGSLVAVLADRDAVTVAAPWLAGREIEHIRVSAEGARVVVVSRSEGRAFIELATIARDRSGTPTALGEPLRVGEDLRIVRDVSWVDQYTLAVLGATLSDVAARPHLLPIGGAMAILPTVEDAVAITSSRNVRSIMLVTADGRLYVREGISWRMAAEAVQDPAFSG